MAHATGTANNLTLERTELRPFGRSIATFGDQALRFSIVIVLGWIGAMKFTAYEAGAIQGLVASSPFTAWLYGVFDLQTTSNLIGSIEIATALALVLAPLHRNIAIIGTAAATVTFAVTLSFLFTAPGWEQSLGGFPALSVVPGQFLLKDIVLLAASISLLGRALHCGR
jgi:uncharacterized membrane protein YkgB